MCWVLNTPQLEKPMNHFYKYIWKLNVSCNINIFLLKWSRWYLPNNPWRLASDSIPMLSWPKVSFMLKIIFHEASWPMSNGENNYNETSPSSTYFATIMCFQIFPLIHISLLGHNGEGKIKEGSKTLLALFKHNIFSQFCDAC